MPWSRTQTSSDCAVSLKFVGKRLVLKRQVCVSRARLASCSTFDAPTRRFALPACMPRFARCTRLKPTRRESDACDIMAARRRTPRLGRPPPPRPSRRGPCCCRPGRPQSVPAGRPPARRPPRGVRRPPAAPRAPGQAARQDARTWRRWRCRPGSAAVTAMRHPGTAQQHVARVRLRPRCHHARGCVARPPSAAPTCIASGLKATSP